MSRGDDIGHFRETANACGGRAYSVEAISRDRFAAMPWIERAPDPALPTGAWLSESEAFVLQQAHDVLVKREPRDLRDLSLAVIKQLGDPRCVAGAEPAVVLAVAVELARRWRASVGDRNDEARTRRADTRAGHVRVAEARKLAAAGGIGAHVLEKALAAHEVPYQQDTPQRVRWIQLEALVAWIDKVRS